ncbi:MFS transporter [Paraburkholderia tropica]|uniref:MFS transporter n=1 Tax=Paraburkholderia tropica TaxID=92647 RepID=UPI002AB07E42|nr:MFS transporter [Paraburkholderia tropica]
MRTCDNWCASVTWRGVARSIPLSRGGHDDPGASNRRWWRRYLALNIVGSFLGPWIYGPISDRFGRRPVYLLFLSMQAVAVPVYLSVGGSLALTLCVGFVVGLLHGGLATGVQPMLGELFGTRIRGRAIGLNNAFVRATAAIAPALVGYLAGRASFGTSMISVAVSLYVFAALGVLLAPETRGAELTADADAADGVGSGDGEKSPVAQRYSTHPSLRAAGVAFRS